MKEINIKFTLGLHTVTHIRAITSDDLYIISVIVNFTSTIALMGLCTQPFVGSVSLALIEFG